LSSRLVVVVEVLGKSMVVVKAFEIRMLLVLLILFGDLVKQSSVAAMVDDRSNWETLSVQLVDSKTMRVGCGGSV
jgi:hypothetical protein